MFYAFQVKDQVFLNQEMPILWSLIVLFRNKILIGLGSRASSEERYYQTTVTMLNNLHSVS